MKRIMFAATAILAVGTTALAFSDEGSRRFSEFLTGLKEAPAIVSTTGTGTFKATLNQDETEIEYVLTFQNLESDIRQAHIHVGHPQNSGGIVLWLCGSEALPGPAGTPRCNESDPNDNRNGSVDGTLTVANIQPLPGNGIAAGEWAEVVALIRAGKTYANVHTANIGAGEIRSQISNRDADHGSHRHQ
jgi:hypothetical protein